MFIFVSAIVTLILLICIELFFRWNINAKFLSNKMIIEHANAYRYKTLISTAKPASKEEFLAKYPTLKFEIPRRYNAQFDYDWNASMPNPNRVSNFFPPGYFEELSKYPHHGNLTFHIKKSFTGVTPEQLIYSYDVNFDKNGGRSTGHKRLKKDATEVLAVGDSWTLGEGIPAGKEYPYQLNQKLSANWNVSNFGFHGYSINDFVARIRNQPQEFEFLRNKKTLVIWVLFDAHFSRAVCSVKCLADQSLEYMHWKPYFYWNGKELIQDGNFLTSQNWHRKLMRLLAQSATLDFFKVDYPFKIRESDVNTFIHLFEEARLKISQVTNLQDFYIVQLGYTAEHASVIDAFKKLGFKYLDYSPYNFENVSDHLNIPFDGHPTSNFDWILTEMLKQDIFGE